MTKITKTMYWALGFSVWMPATAIASVGKFSVQPAAVLALIIIMSSLLRGRLKLDVIMITFMLIWLGGMLISSLVAPDVLKAFRFIVMYMTGMACMIAAYQTSLNGSYSSVKGFLVGGAVSGLYALYQLFGLQNGLPMPLWLNNDRSMSSFAEIALTGNWGSSIARAFAFTPEPSVLAAILAACFMAVVGEMMSDKRRFKTRWLWFVFFAVCAGFLACGSLGLLVSLPISLIIFMVLLSFPGQKGASFRKMGKKAFKFFVPAMSAIAVAYFLGLFQISAIASALERVSGFGTITSVNSVVDADRSSAIRLASMGQAIQIFQEKPILGYGVFVDPDYFLQRFPLKALEKKTGVDSWPLLILAGCGLVGLMGYLLLVGLSYSRARRSPFLLALLIGTLIPTFTQTGNILLYHVWFVLGLCCSQHAARVSSVGKGQHSAEPYSNRLRSPNFAPPAIQSRAC